jgi:hypothetical protein
MAKTQIKNYVFKPGIGLNDNRFPNAYNLLSANKSFIQKEATQWIADQVAAGAAGFVGYTYNQAKCERDVGYVIDAYLNDLRYGGNEKLYDTIKYYWDQDVAQVDGDRQPEIQTHTFIGNLIKTNILTQVAYSASNTEVTQTLSGTASETTQQFTPTDATYTPTTGDMTVTIGTHSLAVGDEFFIAPGGITFTCALDGNASDHPYPRASGVPNDKGKDPYYYTPITITSVTSTTITANVGISSDTSLHTFSSALANSVTAGPNAKINTLAFNTVDVITNGLNALPTKIDTGVSTIKLQGNYNVNQLLLITNTTKNEIIYNFSSSDTGGKVELKKDKISRDPDFAKFLETTDSITIIKLNYNTKSHSALDDIQIFVELTENGKSVVTTRPYDFGTDAIERMRIATPQSMLDADFEYGLQPTKWAAISTLRGYPSVYELPGTDTPVLSVVTDASAGTDGIGQSLITVTTVGPHGIEAGSPITIKALEDTTSGAARAEGSFIVVEVPTSTTFTYYAKSKVGESSGDILSTTYTQLRKAGFYTGSSIANSRFTINSNGSAGTLVAELSVPSGSTVIPYDGPAPSIGAPLVNNPGISTGTQITSVTDTTAGGGVYLTPAVVETVTSGSSTVTVETSSGIVTNLAVDRGDGFATILSSIDGNNLEFTDSFTTNLIPNKKSYINVSTINDTSSGQDAAFNISASGSSYTIDLIVDDGSSYEIGDRIKILGTDLGGATPQNDATILITDTFSDGAILSTSIEGTAFDGTGTVTGVSGTYTFGQGTGASFDITWVDNVYSTVDITSPDPSSGYQVNDLIVIPGDDLYDSGGSPINDLYITVTGIGDGGSITSVVFEGTAPDVIETYNSVTFTTASSGTGAIFNITSDSGSYSAVVDFGGVNYLPTETILISGADLGGITPDNDLTLTIDNVGGTGDIITVSLSGVAYNGGTEAAVFSTPRSGTGATFDVDLNAGVYTVSINDGGSLYGDAQTFTIPGTSLFGQSPANDLTITIDTIDGISTGVITAITSTGTASAGAGSYTNITGFLEPLVGSGATFDIVRNFTNYDTIVLNTAGTNYKVGNRFTIEATNLDGISPFNDITGRVTAINEVTGGIVSVITSYEEAAYGVNFDLLCTVGLSEPTILDITAGSTADFEQLASLGITFDNAHGLVPGNTFIVDILSDDGINNHALAAGSYIATNIPAVDQLEFQARAAGTISIDSLDINGIIYPRPDSFFVHRPFDGGVQLGTGGPQHGAQAIRQSKKYIRYQSGKGIMYTTGALFAPSYDLRSLTADGVEVGSLITVVTDDNDHGVQVGGIVRILGVETPGYNSGPETAVPPTFDYEVVDVVDERTYKIRAQRRLGATEAILGFGSQMSVVAWHGATVRSGIFDDQNGIFWEFDGTQISVVQRTGTRQLAGAIELKVDNNLVTGTNTRFLDQLKAGDRIIIKGMTHVVSHVNSQTECTITPDWRGVVDIQGAKANLIVDKKTKQADFNLDRLDGTGPSGYDIDIAKMQMIGIQYSWYGAGFIDFMLRGSDGNFVFAHRMRNSNVNTEAFMRSGNLPVRYEVTNEGPPGKLAAAMDASQTTLELIDGSFFPTSGTIYIDNEIINYTGRTGNTLTGLQRGSTYNNFQAGADRSYSAGSPEIHNDRTGVILISQTITPLISHWGSAFITDGAFDEDRGYIFSYAATGVPVSTTKNTAFMIRLSPSVSNALTGDLGERELLNRAQLLLQGLEITSDTSTGGLVVQGVLNPQNYPLDPGSVSWSNLSGAAQGGQPSFAQIAPGGAIDWNGGAIETTASVAISADIQTSTYTPLVFGANENNSPIELLTSVYNGVGPAFTGAEIYEANGNAYSGGSQGTYLITNIRTSGNETLIDFRSTTGRTRRAQNFTGTPGIYFKQPSYTGLTNKLIFAKAAWDASGAVEGTSVATSDTNWPAGTAVSSVVLKTLGATEFYEVTFSQTSINELTTSDSVTFLFGNPPFAQPGETVFSFIANPGERSTLDLSQLKELTNTPLGGRGTYPNGPDVLAINVYKISGTEVAANIILKWGEAQA